LIEDKGKIRKPFLLARYGSGELKNLFFGERVSKPCKQCGVFSLQEKFIRGF
jgi:hypothetical protein